MKNQSNSNVANRWFKALIHKARELRVQFKRSRRPVDRKIVGLQLKALRQEYRRLKAKSV